MYSASIVSTAEFKAAQKRILEEMANRVYNVLRVKNPLVPSEQAEILRAQGELIGAKYVFERFASLAEDDDGNRSPDQ